MEINPLFRSRAYNTYSGLGIRKGTLINFSIHVSFVDP